MYQKIERILKQAGKTEIKIDGDTVSLGGNRGEVAVLEYLKDNRIFSVELVDNKKSLQFTEECDEHFVLDLNKRRVRELANQLLTISNKMLDSI